MSRILIADDDRDICELVSFKLAALGHHVIVEHDGEGALAAARTESPELIVLDWMMPRLTGLEVCVALQTDPALARIPVILLTARAQDADIQRGFNAGANDYIVKPFSPRVLASRVHAMLARVSH
ncbi:MAG: response regulator [Ilumatobacteraceae bacterium]|nr:response regulator [Ilumatobacteraceae bacterium]